MSTQTDIIFTKICAESLEQKASEIYLFPAQIPFIRVDAKVQPLPGGKVLSETFIQESIDSLLTSEEQARLKREFQIVLVKEIGKQGPVKINVFFQKGALALSLKLLAGESIDLEKLGLPEMVKDLTELSQGIVFVTGPRDSGRSTLVAALLDHINKTQAKFIATLEAPIRYKLRPLKSIVEQREVPQDVKSFQDGLAYIRQRNVDVVMVSRVDDQKVMKEIFAISQAATLVFVIMDTDSAAKTVQRVLHFFPAEEALTARYFLSENLGAIVSSRLIPKIGRGRIRALEVLPGTPAVRTIIQEGKFHQLSSILQTGDRTRCISLDQYLADLVTSGEVLAEEAVKYATNEELFRSLLRR